MEGIEWDLQLKMRDYYITRSASEFFKKWLLLDFYGKLWREKKRMIETENPRIFWRRIALGPGGWLTLAINHLLVWDLSGFTYSPKRWDFD